MTRIQKGIKRILIRFVHSSIKQLVKIAKFCFESKKNLLLILIFLIIPIINNVNANNIFSQNPSNPSFNDNNSSKEFRTLNWSPSNTPLNYSERNFFYLKSGDLSIPISFFASEKNVINNAIYDTDKNALLVTLNPLVFNYSSLVIQIPREILDSKTTENKDSNFTVLADGKPSKFSEIQHKEESEKNSNSSATTTATATSTTKNSTISNFFEDIPNRKLLIELDKDTKVIEIIGNDLTANQTANQTANKDVVFAIMLTALLLILSVSLALIYILYKGGRLKSLSKII